MQIYYRMALEQENLTSGVAQSEPDLNLLALSYDTTLRELFTPEVVQMRELKLFCKKERLSSPEHYTGLSKSFLKFLPEVFAAKGDSTSY